MTTQVTVKTHDWPVEITLVDGDGLVPKHSSFEVVNPNDEKTINIHSGRSAIFRELPKP